jgi:hypothetical protein
MMAIVDGTGIVGTRSCGGELSSWIMVLQATHMLAMDNSKLE